MDQRHVKAQSAMEFIILVGALLLVFLVVMTITLENTSTLNRKKEVLIGEDIVTKVQKEIHLASRVLDGYSRTFTLPEKLGSKDYTILLTNNQVIVTIGGNDFWRSLPPVTGSVQKGSNTVNKTNGVIYLN